MLDQPTTRLADHAVIADIRQDQLFAGALERSVREFGAFVAIVYVAQRGERDLIAAAVGGAPPAVFTMPDRIHHESTHASATAWRTGRPVTSSLPVATPEADPSSQLISYPYSVVSVPLTSGDGVFGALTALWVPPRPAATPRLLDGLAEVGARLEADLRSLPPREEAAAIRPSPMIVPVLGRTSPAAGPHRWGLPELAGSSALSQMYHFHKLSARLNRASGTEGVVCAASELIMRPFGAHALVLVVGQAGRLRVVGHDGNARLARSIHGCPLDRRAPTADVLRANKPLFLPDRDAVLRLYPDTEVTGQEALAVVPVAGSGQVLGCLVLGFDTSRDFPADEQTLLLMMSAHLAVAMERESLTEAEHTLIDALQRKLLPRTLPEWSELVATARYQSPPTASEMGGDWYDVIALPGRQVGLVVGDVEGHSADSAVIMGQLRSSLHAYAAEGHDPADVLARSSTLLAELDTELYATCCFVRVDLEFGVAEVALAGHPAPLLRGPNGTIVTVDAPANVPLAVMPGEHAYATAETAIAPDTLLMLYTDGLARERRGDPSVDARRLLESVEGVERRSLDGLADMIMQGVVDTECSARPFDDIVLLLALFEGNPSTPLPRVDRMSITRHDIQGVKAARRFVRGFLRRRGLSCLVDDLEVISSEAVTNALIHADSEVEVRLREYPDRVHLEVRDTDAKPPIPTSVTSSPATNEIAEHGRGMGIVDWLATTWGSSPNGRGKTVWADVAKQQRE
ncbi:SpoIIE family protein phosphatase [Streptomyces sp. PA03-3a]|nr:SpoIIE family protein phosphatase [Streptomyces sp. PA03-3a]